MSIRFLAIKFQFAKWTATSLGLGLLPKAPGTWGSLAGLFFAYLAFEKPLWISVLGMLSLYLLGSWSILEFHRGNAVASTKGIDRSEIVIDEVIGQWLTCLALSMFAPSWNTLSGWGLAFLLFRFFDILKPWPISKIDQWSKSQTGIKAAQGVIWDDLLAGIFGFLCLFIIKTIWGSF